MIEVSPRVYAYPRSKGKMSFFDISHLDFYGEFLACFSSISVLPFFEGLQHFDDELCINSTKAHTFSGVIPYILEGLQRSLTH